MADFDFPILLPFIKLFSPLAFLNHLQGFTSFVPSSVELSHDLYVMSSFPVMLVRDKVVAVVTEREEVVKAIEA